VTDSAISITSEEEEDEEAGEDLGDLLLEVLPGDGTTIGNLPTLNILKYGKFFN